MYNNLIFIQLPMCSFASKNSILLYTQTGLSIVKVSTTEILHKYSSYVAIYGNYRDLVLKLVRRLVVMIGQNASLFLIFIIKETFSLPRIIN